MNESPVVVGVDGTPSSDQAIEWAAAEAAARNEPLRIVCALGRSPVFRSTALYGPDGDPEFERLRQHAAAQFDRQLEAARLGHPEVKIDGQVIQGDPVHVLVEESGTASAVVVGSRRLGAGGSVILGSVGAGVATRSHCPAVVIRSRIGDLVPDAGVVIGVSGDPVADDPVLDFALGYADRHGLPALALMCVTTDSVPGSVWLLESMPRDEAVELLEESVSRWSERYPSVQCTRDVLIGHPIDTLLAASAGHRLIAVGSRSRRQLTGMLLGSVSLGIVHHADCPVAVIPQGKRADRASREQD